jgi:hypothetical protein
MNFIDVPNALNTRITMSQSQRFVNAKNTKKNAEGRKDNALKYKSLRLSAA